MTLKDTDPAILRMIVIVVTIIAGVVVTWIKTSRGLEKVGKKTDRAIELAVPTGNGFAKETKDALASIRALIGEFKKEAETRDARIEEKLDAHLQAHATADVQRRPN